MTATFTSIDELWAAFPQQHGYHYAYHDPVNFRDPSGINPGGDAVFSMEGANGSSGTEEHGPSRDDFEAASYERQRRFNEMMYGLEIMRGQWSLQAHGENSRAMQILQQQQQLPGMNSPLFLNETTRRMAMAQSDVQIKFLNAQAPRPLNTTAMDVAGFAMDYTKSWMVADAKNTWRLNRGSRNQEAKIADLVFGRLKTAKSLLRYSKALGWIGVGFSAINLGLYYEFDGAGIEPTESLFGQENDTEYLLWADAGMSVVSMFGGPKGAVAAVVYTIGRNIDAPKTPGRRPRMTFPEWVPQRDKTAVNPKFMRVD